MKKVAVLWNADWPVIDAPPVSLPWLRSTFAGFEIEILSKPADRSRLKAGKFVALVMVNGSAFPGEFHNAILAFLKEGGHLFYLGGDPFSRPFRMVKGVAQIEPATPAFARSLGISQSFPLAITARHEVDPVWKKAGLTRCWRMFYRLNALGATDIPRDDLGWEGPIDARIQPQAIVKEESRHVASVAIIIHHENGPFQGSRWMVAPCQLARLPDAEAVRSLFRQTVRPYVNWRVTPGLAVYRPEEQPTISLQSSTPRAKIRVRISSKNTVMTEKIAASGSSISLSKGLSKGFYKIECLDLQDGTVLSSNGFWIAQPGDLRSGRPLGVTPDWLTRDAKPFAAAGTTYMCGVEHRDFLLRPNAAAWLRDMEAMRRAGTNIIRTGLWQKWAPHAHRDGRPRREALRAFEAFLLCAGQCDIPVIFNFFAFVPYAWKGQHPYIDAEAVATQKSFLSGFASTAKACDFVVWDLINEPSVTDNKHVWSTLPVGSAEEKAAWLKWIAREYGDIDRARLAFRLPPQWNGEIPAERDFADSSVFDKRYPLLSEAFQRFAQQTFCEWTTILARELRRAGAKTQLVTVGQDEGGANTRPSPLFHGHLVDFTSNHPWHYQDDILWDALIAHKRGVPLLVEEVGVMPRRTPDGMAARSLADTAMLLERKLALSFGAGASGFIQWLWNSNSYLPSDTEAGIGLLLEDGAEKPEMRVYAGMAEFARQLTPWLGPVQEPDVAVVYPQADSSSVRPWAIDAHQRAIKALEYRLGLATRVVGEYQGEDVGDAKLIVVPAHEALSEGCWKHLLEAVKRGACLTVTGDFRRGADHHCLNELEFLSHAITENWVSAVEIIRIGAKRLDAIFPTAVVKPLRKLVSPGPNQIRTHKLGRGTIFVSPIPLECSISESPLIEFYRAAAVNAGLALAAQSPGRLCRKVVMPKAELVTVVNETSVSARLRELLPGLYRSSFAKESLPAGRSGLYLFERKSGRCLASYQPPPVE